MITGTLIRSKVIPFAGVYRGYWTDAFTLFFIEIIALQFAELKRLQDYRWALRSGSCETQPRIRV